MEAADLQPDPNFYAMKYLPASETNRLMHDLEDAPIGDIASFNASAQMHNILVPRHIPTSNEQYHEATRSLPIDRWSSIESAIRRNEAQTNSLAESLVRSIMFNSRPLLLPAAATSAQQVARPIPSIGAQDAAAQLPVDALQARTLPIDTTSILGTAVRQYDAQSNSIINSIFRSIRSDSQPLTAAAAAASVASRFL
jgi:hypothetical protein